MFCRETSRVSSHRAVAQRALRLKNVPVKQSMKSVFFYGLFMDQELLKAKGLNPANPRLAYVAGYGLRIGQWAGGDLP